MCVWLVVLCGFCVLVGLCYVVWLWWWFWWWVFFWGGGGVLVCFFVCWGGFSIFVVSLGNRRKSPG